MLELEQQYADEIIAHALAEDPNECCGILAGLRGKVSYLYRMTNVEQSPYRYSMDPKELYRTYREIDDTGKEVLAIYHSHTHSAAYPSPTDVRLATWPEAHYILVSLQIKERPILRVFRIEGEIIKEEGIRIV